MEKPRMGIEKKENGKDVCKHKKISVYTVNTSLSSLVRCIMRMKLTTVTARIRT